MELDERLGTYEATRPPSPLTAAARLRLVWTAPDGDGDAVAEAAGQDLSDDATILPLLAHYRITRVPARAAS